MAAVSSGVIFIEFRPLRWLIKSFSLFIEQVFYLEINKSPLFLRVQKISTIINKKFVEIEKSDLSNEILNKYQSSKKNSILFIGRVDKKIKVY